MNRSPWSGGSFQVAEKKLTTFLKTLNMDETFEIHCNMLDQGRTYKGSREHIMYKWECDFNGDAISRSMKMRMCSSDQQILIAQVCTGQSAIKEAKRLKIKV